MLNFISMLGNAWTDLAGGYKELSWVGNLFQYLYPILYAILAVVGAAGVIYSIVLGINLAKAEDQSKRDEAKKRLVTTIIAVAVTLVLIIFFNELLPLIIKALKDSTIKDAGTGTGTGTTGGKTTFIHF